MCSGFEKAALVKEQEEFADALRLIQNLIVTQFGVPTCRQRCCSGSGKRSRSAGTSWLPRAWRPKR